MFQIVKKLKLLKKNLRILNTNHSKTIEDEAKEDRMALHQVQYLLQVNPMDFELQLREKALYQKFRNSSYLDEMHLQQKIKATWIQLGDDNTSYFYSVIKHMKLKQAETQLKNEQGEWEHNPNNIAQLFVEYYEGLLGHTTTSRIHAFMITSKDVKEAIFQIDCNKSPSPDGYGSGFFKAAWPVIGQDISEVVLDFFQNGKLLKLINSTIIALIPKVDAPEYAN
ncbi:uncharacterized protein LOC107765442 [Nicotiana tabacum]|uniref:Uncharacterized protein LOC107765442 n=1 Tax=Nicotiana tabacum TaxID=4097 RepID=A0A1S3XHX7_TOBAC|nr:PREDICTED: uncharacterized protein LOC107765442 [Nicotiana tabacum]